MTTSCRRNSISLVGATLDLGGHHAQKDKLISFPTFRPDEDKSIEEARDLHEVCMRQLSGFASNCATEEDAKWINDVLSVELQLSFQAIESNKNEKCFDTERCSRVQAAADGSPELKVELQSYPFGCSRRRKDERPLILSSTHAFMMERKGWPSIESTDDGSRAVIKACIEDNKPFLVRLKHDGVALRKKAAEDHIEEEMESSLLSAKNSVQYELSQYLKNKNEGADIIQEDVSGDIRVYLRSIRQMLRYLAKKGLTGAAELVEAATKGLVTSFIELIDDVNKKNAALQEEIRKQEEADAQLEELKFALTKVKLKEEMHDILLRDTAARHETEKSHLLQRISDLSDKIAELTPNGTELDKLFPIIGDFNCLVVEMEHEVMNQGRILQDVGKITRSMVQKRNAGDPGKIYCPSRVVQHSNGEIVLKAYDTFERHVQAQVTDLCNFDGPPLLRMPKFRRHMAISEVIKTQNIREPAYKSATQLDTDIGQIFTYAMLTGALREVDMFDCCWMSFAELPSAPKVRHAYSRLSRIYEALLTYVHCPHTSSLAHQNDRLVLQPSSLACAARIRLFSRMIEFCPVADALPHPIPTRVLEVLHMLENQNRAPTVGSQVVIPVPLLFSTALKEIIRSDEGFHTFYKGLCKAARREEDDRLIMANDDDKVFVSLLQDALHRDVSPRLATILRRAEDHEDAEKEKPAALADLEKPPELKEMRDAIKEVFGHLVEWEKDFIGLSPNLYKAILNKLGVMAERENLYVPLYIGLELIVDALMAEINADMSPFKKMWASKNPKNVAQISQVVRTYDSTVKSEQVHSFLMHLEMYSHCLGTAEVANDPFIGDFERKGENGEMAVDFPLAKLAMIRSGIVGRSILRVNPVHNDSFGIGFSTPAGGTISGAAPARQISPMGPGRRAMGGRRMSAATNRSR